MKFFRQTIGRNGSHAFRRQFAQTAQIDAQAIRSKFGYFFDFHRFVRTASGSDLCNLCNYNPKISICEKVRFSKDAETLFYRCPYDKYLLQFMFQV
mgnify:CR=1 FL=1